MLNIYMIMDVVSEKGLWRAHIVCLFCTLFSVKLSCPRQIMNKEQGGGDIRRRFCGLDSGTLAPSSIRAKGFVYRLLYILGAQER